MALLVAFSVPASPVAAEPAGSIKWVVDHDRKTITVTVKLQIYSACSGDPAGTKAEQAVACRPGVPGQATRVFLVDKIKKNVNDIWNKPHHYRCYRLIVNVDIERAADKEQVAPDRIGVRIDPTATGIRDYVDADGTRNYLSNDPADRLDPADNAGDHPTTWGENSNAYAHEVGHLLGLDDGYEDVTDPTTGKVTSKRKPGAPDDLMSASENQNVTQETVDRLVERNGDRLFDKDGEKVELKDLVCEPQFLVQLTARQVEYHASHLMNSARGCPAPPSTSSDEQTLTIKSEKVEVTLLEDPTYVPLGYLLIPSFDALIAHYGLSGRGRSAAAVGLFDLPVKVEVYRANDRPATGEVPELRDTADNTCASDGGTPPPSDCGFREYSAWLAMSQIGANELWPISSSLPALLKDLGYQANRLDRLYKNCTGPTPWPGAFAQQSGAASTRGKLPSLAELSKVANDWINDGTPGSIDISGRADRDEARPGALFDDEFTWTLTLCPLNRDGQPPPDCP